MANVAHDAVVTIRASKERCWLVAPFASMLALAVAAGCSHGGYNDGKRDGMRPNSRDFSTGLDDLVTSNTDGPVTPMDFATPSDVAARTDLAAPPDLATMGGLITGGRCMSGTMGATAFRVR